MRVTGVSASSCLLLPVGDELAKSSLMNSWSSPKEFFSVGRLHWHEHGSVFSRPYLDRLVFCHNVNCPQLCHGGVGLGLGVPDRSFGVLRASYKKCCFSPDRVATLCGKRSSEHRCKALTEAQDAAVCGTRGYSHRGPGGMSREIRIGGSLT